MFLLIASYIKPVEEITPYIAEHAMWVKKYVNEGIFLLAGPKSSKLGGVILCKSIDKLTLQTILIEDSYVKADVCDYQIVEFNGKLTATGFEILLNEV